VVLDEFPEWLQRSSLDRRIKDTNTKLKRIANQKKENRLSVFQGNKKEKKKNNSGEDDLTYGPRNCDISKFSSIKLHHLLLLCENSTRQHLVTTAVVDRISRPELWIWITSVSAVTWKLWVRVWNRSSLEVYAIANAR
jgi:hypothetical protein